MKICMRIDPDYAKTNFWMCFFYTGNRSVGCAVIARHNEWKKLIEQRLINFKAHAFFHNHDAIDKLSIRMFGAIEQQFIYIFYFY
jgi:hypothetical protein